MTYTVSVVIHCVLARTSVISLAADVGPFTSEDARTAWVHQYMSTIRSSEQHWAAVACNDGPVEKKVVPEGLMYLTPEPGSMLAATEPEQVLAHMIDMFCVRLKSMILEGTSTVQLEEGLSPFSLRLQ